ncbi:MAG: hypothetical protein HY553_19805 [Elusimicrobia bacterium]|nr:hypothetical protein [Elusimicrobiota bacterium]
MLTPVNSPDVVVLPRPEPRPSLWTSIRLSGLLELAEPEYRRWLAGIEADPLYARLRAGRLVRREPRRDARFAWPTGAPADGELLAGPATSLPGLDDELVRCIRRLGRETFERAFLRGEDPGERAAAAAAAGLGTGEAERVCALVDSLWTCEPPAPAPALEAPVSCVAALEREGEGWSVAYYSPHYLRGRYRVDYDALAAARGAWSPDEASRVRELVRQLELANHKLSALGRILEALPRLQPAFLATGDPDALRPARQNALARELAVSASTICRALAGRAVRLSQGRLVALADFFPTTRPRTERLIALAAAERPDATDEQLRRDLESRFGLRVTRRLVNLRRGGRA